MRRIFYSFMVAVAALAVISSCAGKEHKFSKQDLQIINSNQDELLKIYTIENPDELAVLRAISYNLTKREIHSKAFEILSERMIRTVSDTVVGGVGLAAPQIGINKAVVAVQRFDKPGAPFEVYPNVQIVNKSEEVDIEYEGCLSIPGKREYVDRAIGVEIEYYSIPDRKIVRDTIRHSYTARIFQHEIDHLDGILYTDYPW